MTKRMLAYSRKNPHDRRELVVTTAIALIGLAAVFASLVWW